MDVETDPIVPCVHEEQRAWQDKSIPVTGPWP